MAKYGIKITYSNGDEEDGLYGNFASKEEAFKEICVLAVKEAGADASVQAEMLADISGLLTETKAALKKLEAVTEEAAGKEEGKVQSEFYHFSVVPAMEGLRTPVDELEMIVDKEVWPMPSYGDLLFEV